MYCCGLQSNSQTQTLTSNRHFSGRPPKQGKCTLALCQTLGLITDTVLMAQESLCSCHPDQRERSLIYRQFNWRSPFWFSLRFLPVGRNDIPCEYEIRTWHGIILSETGNNKE